MKKLLILATLISFQTSAQAQISLESIQAGKQKITKPQAPRKPAQANEKIQVESSKSFAEDLHDEQTAPSFRDDDNQDMRGAREQFDVGNPSVSLEPLNQPEKGPPQVDSKLKTGTHIYKVKPTTISKMAGFRVGPFSPGNLEGDIDGITYNSIYKRGTVLATFDYEFYVFKRFGKLGIKPSIGFFANSGTGRFKNNVSQEAEEGVNIYGFPMTLSAVYHLQFWDKQILVPYGEIGASYIGFTEHRPDKSGFAAFKFGGAPAWVWAAGGQLQLDFLDKAGIWQLDTEYGINHIYLVGGVRQIIGLSSRFDFTTLVYEGGVWFEF